MSDSKVYTRRTEVALASVTAERLRQEERKRQGRFKYTCADAEMNHYERFAVLGEEVGEVAREVLTNAGKRLARDTNGTDAALYKELAQVAAVAVAWMESLLIDDPVIVPAAPSPLTGRSWDGDGDD